MSISEHPFSEFIRAEAPWEYHPVQYFILFGQLNNTSLAYLTLFKFCQRIIRLSADRCANRVVIQISASPWIGEGSVIVTSNVGISVSIRDDTPKELLRV